jgi:Protein of unknown function (DUF2975)
MSVSASQVQKIMRWSALARNITSVPIAFGGVGLVVMFVVIAMGGVTGQKVFVGPYIFTPGALEPWSARLYVMLMLLAGGALAMAALLQIRAVFADLARGNIFCDANVRRIRNLGWLTIAGGIGCWLIPVTNAAYFMLSGHDDIAFRDEPTLFTGLGQIVSGGLYLLLSWIMAVGLGVREDAEELQRDAELVI